MIDPAMLLQQIFGKQAAQPMQISGQTGMGPTGPSKFQQFGSLLSQVGQAGGAAMPGGGGATMQPNPQNEQNRQQAMMLLKSMFGRRGGPSGGGMTGGGGNGGMPQSKIGGIS